MKKVYTFVTTAIVLLLFMGALIYNGYIWFNNPSEDKFPIRGIDVSEHQKDINWKEVKKNNFQFIFIKATEGMDFKDRCFLENWKNAKDIGLRRGAYHFFTFQSSGKDQARNFIDTVPVEKSSLPPVIDIEFGGNSKVIPDKEKFTKELRDFTAVIELHYKVKPILYITHEAYEKYIVGDFTDYKIWIRDVIKSPKLKDNRDWILWQYNSRGRVKGFSTFVDLNVFKGNMKELETLVGHE